MKILVEYSVVLYFGNGNGSSRVNGYVVIMRVFRNCPHCSVSTLIRKLKVLFFYFLPKTGCCFELLAKLLLKPKRV